MDMIAYFQFLFGLDKYKAVNDNVFAELNIVDINNDCGFEYLDVWNVIFIQIDGSVICHDR